MQLKLPPNYRYVAQHSMSEIEPLRRLGLILLTGFVMFGAFIAALLIPYSLNLFRGPTKPVLPDSVLLVIIALLFLGLVLPQAFPILIKYAILRSIGGTPSLCLVKIGHKGGYVDLYDRRLYLSLFQYCMFTTIPYLATIALMLGLLTIESPIILVSLIGGLPLRAATLIWPFVNVVRALRYRSNIRVREEDCGVIEIYGPASFQQDRSELHG